ncbi:MAG: PadR family transcriptional regulator [Oscillospiraceae bacterium]|jgi:PadR family transcriptional regulator PadR|nr:PadR family transcriptional regulator [Oscillospiraceae bacterium]
MNIQFKKGALDLCVMALLEKKDCYGFELASTVSNHIDISEGTIYPLLKRLKDDMLVDTYLMESTEGPPRKYYTLTPTGRGRYSRLLGEWKSFTSGVERIINDGKGELN